jgi:hypothetical protein
MCKLLLRARASNIWLKYVASTPTFGLSLGKLRGQVSLLKSLLLTRFVVYKRRTKADESR